MFGRGSNGKGSVPAGGEGRADAAPDELARQSIAFTQIVLMLMRSPVYRQLTLADIEWLVLPPVLGRQYAMASGQPAPGGPTVPMAVALWAFVSEDVDRRLSLQQAAPIRLQPGEWQSGDICWLVDAVGEPHAVKELLRQLGETTLKDIKVKVLSAGDGKRVGDG